MYTSEKLIFKHPEFSDWEKMYQNVWRHPETARYMLWSVTATEEDAKDRMRRSIRFQQEHTAWFIYEKATGEPIGFCGFREIGDGVMEDTGIAIGPEFTGKGYGKEVLHALTEIAKKDCGATRFVASCRRQNSASRGMILGCGFRFTHAEDRIDPRDGSAYQLEFYEKKL